MSRPTCTVHEADALVWLEQNALPDDAAICTSLPNVDEFTHKDLERWREWFVAAARLVLEKTPRKTAAVFFQTDIKHGGIWIDKAWLVQRAAEQAGASLLWHKIAQRAPAGTATHHRPGFAHLLCFSHELRIDADDATPDVLPQLGEMTWPRAIGIDVAHFAVTWLREHTKARVIVDPFCGLGTVLAIANQHDLDAIGIERNPGRAAKARDLTI